MWMEETEIDRAQNFHISKMSNFTHYATSLRKFPTETTDLRFPRKFIINSYTKILLSVCCILTPFIEILKLQFWERVAVNII